MRGHIGCALVVLAGCGRLQFDPLGDAGGGPGPGDAPDGAGGSMVGFLGAQHGTSIGLQQVTVNLGVNIDETLIAIVATKPDVMVTAMNGLGVTWTRVAEQCAEDVQARVTAFAGVATTNIIGGVTATLSAAPINSVMTVGIYTGANGVSGAIAFNHAGIDGSCAVGTLTTSFTHTISGTRRGAIVAAFALKAATATFAFGTGISARAEKAIGTAGDRIVLHLGDRPVMDSGTHTVDGSITGGGTNEWAGLALALQPR